MPLQRLKIVNSQPTPIKATDWMHLERKIDELTFDWQFGEILNLEGLKTIKFKETDSDVILMAEMKATAECDCSDYKTDLKKNGWTTPRMVLDTPIRCKRTSIYFRAQRYFCDECRKSVQQNIEGLHDTHHLTARLVEYIKKNSLSIYKSFSDIMRETGVNEKVIRNIFTPYAAELERNRRISTPVWIAIDEIYPSTKKYPRCVITSPLERKVIDLLEDNNAKTLSEWLLQLPDRHKIEIVTIDMSSSYASTVKRLLPNAAIVNDRYHVHNLLNVAIKETLDVTRISLTKKELSEFMRPEYLLLMSRFRLSPHKPVSGNNKADSKTENLSEMDAVNQWFKNIPDV